MYQRNDIPCTALTLSTYSYTGVKDSTFQINAYAIPTGTTDRITYSSNNTDLAYVSDTGIVTLVAAGAVTITVRCGTKAAYLAIRIVNDELEIDPDEPGPSPIDPDDVPPDTPTEPPEDIEPVPETRPCKALSLSRYEHTDVVGSSFDLTVYPYPTDTTDSIVYKPMLAGVISIEPVRPRTVKITLNQIGYTTLEVRCGAMVKTVKIAIVENNLVDDPDEEPPEVIDPDDVPEDNPTEEPENIPCVGLSLSTYEYTGPIGTTYQPTVYLTPANTTDLVTFSPAANTNVISIDPFSGMISLNKKGNTLVAVRCGSHLKYLKIIVVDNNLVDDPDEAPPEIIDPGEIPDDI